MTKNPPQGGFFCGEGGEIKVFLGIDIIAYESIMETRRDDMYETMAIDSKTIIIKSDNERELSEVIDFVSKKDKDANLRAFLDFASSNRKIVKNYKFNREDCYAK